VLDNDAGQHVVLLNAAGARPARDHARRQGAGKAGREVTRLARDNECYARCLPSPGAGVGELQWPRARDRVMPPRRLARWSDASGVFGAVVCCTT